MTKEAQMPAFGNSGFVIPLGFDIRHSTLFSYDSIDDQIAQLHLLVARFVDGPSH